jgi:hypothetical protein
MTSAPRKKPGAARAKGNMSPEMKRLRRRMSQTSQSISTATLRGLGGIFELVFLQAEMLGAEVPEAFPVRMIVRGVTIEMVFEKALANGMTWRQSHRIFVPKAVLLKEKS